MVAHQKIIGLIKGMHYVKLSEQVKQVEHENQHILLVKKFINELVKQIEKVNHLMLLVNCQYEFEPKCQIIPNSCQNLGLLSP